MLNRRYDNKNVVFLHTLLDTLIPVPDAMLILSFSMTRKVVKTAKMFAGKTAQLFNFVNYQEWY